MSRFWLLLLVVLAGAGMLVACEKSDDGPTGPGDDDPTGIPDRIARARDVDPILADGVDAVDLFVIVVDADRRALGDVGVSFSTTAGSIIPLATTDDDGIAETRLTAPASATDLTATVTASVSTSGAPLPDGAFVLLTAERVTKELAAEARDRFRAPMAPGVAATAAEISTQIPVRLLGVTLNVSATPASLPADGRSTATIGATLVETTTRIPLDGREIRFGASAGSITGRATTDASGTAAASLTSTSPGATAQIAAFYGDLLTAETSVAFVAPLPPASLVVTAERTSVAADGLASTLITATARDESGDPPPAGTAVSFSATDGVLDRVLPTDAQGVATARLRAVPGRTGTARVTAILEALRGTVDVKFVSGSATQIVVKEVRNPAIGVRESGSEGTAFITYEVRDAAGIPLDADHPATVAFAVVPKTGEIDAAISPASATTNADGLVQVVVQAGLISGAIEVEAKSGALAAKPVRIAIHGGLPDPAHFSVSTERLNIAGLVFDGIHNGITARVGDRHGNPVPLETAVWFACEFGLVQGSAFTDDHGEATVWEITAAPRPQIPGGDGLVRVTAQTVSAAGNRITTSTLVMWSGPTILEITSPASGFTVDNGGSIPITFRLSDANGNPLVGGTQISVETTAGDLGGSTQFTLPDTQSTAYTTFSVVLADDDPENVRPQATTVTVTVTSQNGNRQASITGTVN